LRPQCPPEWRLAIWPCGLFRHAPYAIEPPNS
jgi:hypothetical protein